MILVDTSVWIDHLSRGSPALSALLEESAVLIHPFVLGEIACGNLNNRSEIVDSLAALPSAPVATDSEALEFIDRHVLMGQAIGYIDVHLLASAALAGDASLWTKNGRLRGVATELGLAFRDS